VGRSAPARASKNIIREQLFAGARLRAIEWANPDGRSGRLQAGSYERHALWRAAVTNMHNRLQQRRNRDPSGKASLPKAHTFFAGARLRAIEWANPDDRSGRLQAGSYEWHASWRAVATKVCDRRGAAIRRGERFSAIHPFIATKGYIMVVRPPRGAATPCEPEPGSVRRPSPTAPVEASPPDSPNGANP
jgi:hypothetical protein